jgi:peptidyl-prolyl cis-trans isomerase A (cyclophilin A)
VKARSPHLAAAILIASPLAGSAAAQSADKPVAGVVRVRLLTSAGPIVLALDAKHAPKTTTNFLAYVDDGRLDGTVFYRAARNKYAPRTGFIEGGVSSDRRRALDPVVLEPTSTTGLHHVDGAISMARDAAPNSATGDFSLLVGPSPQLDAKPGKPGYAAFGHVVAGMDVVKKILASATAPGGSGAMKGEMIVAPVTIVRAQRLDGTAHPTGGPKPWLLNFHFRR